MKDTSEVMKLPDTQAQEDSRNVRINRVGVSEVCFPLLIQRADGRTERVKAKLAMYGSLLHKVKGTNMCYDKKTEVLTKERGWIFFKDLKTGEEVATLSSSGFFEWQNCTATMRYRHQGKMYQVQGRSLNLLVTPNHYLVTDKGLHMATSLYHTPYRMTRNCSWAGTKHKIVELKAHQDNSNEDVFVYFQMNDFLKLLGFYLAEGCTAKQRRGTSGGVILVNNDRKILVELKNILKRAGLNPTLKRNPSYSKGFVLSVYNKPLFEYMRQFGKSPVHYIPRAIKDLSPKQLNIFLTYYLKGDGGKTEKAFYTVSKRLAEDLQEVFIKCGYVVTLSKRSGERSFYPHRPLYAGYYNNNPICTNPRVNSCDGGVWDQWVNYKGLVYCCEVPNHTLLVRREGIHCWSGNSRFIEVLEERSDTALSPTNFKELLIHLKQKLKADDVYIAADFDFELVRNSPVTNKHAIAYCHGKYVGQLNEKGEYKFMPGVSTGISTVCPCSKTLAMADEHRGIGRGAHNQRGYVSVQVHTPGNDVTLELLSDLASNSGSVALYPLLKRPDEKYVTELGYKNPKFVEDVVRDLTVSVKSKLANLQWFRVKCKNKESIHFHNAVAYVEERLIDGLWQSTNYGFF